MQQVGLVGLGLLGSALAEKFISAGMRVVGYDLEPARRDEFASAGGVAVDGAGIRGKLFNVAIPGIKSLIAINFIGVMIGTIRGGSEFVLAMTGGGPYTPYGQTELVGLHIFWQAFGYLRFGAGTAMAWVLGAMLIGFTVVQLKRISRMEFRAAGGTPAGAGAGAGAGA